MFSFLFVELDVVSSLFSLESMSCDKVSATCSWDFQR